MQWSRDRQIGRLQTHIETVDSFTMVGLRVLMLEACWFGFTLSWAFSRTHSWAPCIHAKVSIHMFFLNALVFTTYDTISMPFSHLIVWTVDIFEFLQFSHNSRCDCHYWLIANLILVCSEPDKTIQERARELIGAILSVKVFILFYYHIPFFSFFLFFFSCESNPICGFSIY